MSGLDVSSVAYAGDTLIIDVEIWNDDANAPFDWLGIGIKASAAIRAQDGGILLTANSPADITSPRSGLASIRFSGSTEAFGDQIADFTLWLTDPVSGDVSTVKVAQIPIRNSRFAA